MTLRLALGLAIHANLPMSELDRMDFHNVVYANNKLHEFLKVTK